MRRIIKNLAAIILVPLTRWYLRKERTFTYSGIVISVLPGVFHPGLFPSTRFILQYLKKQNLAGRTLLEVGSGTGLIAVVAAKAGAQVTAVDVSLAAVRNTTLNAAANNANIEVLHSDLFDNLKGRSFDWIIINPPYYARQPRNEDDFAWYCGKNFEYFRKLFHGLTGLPHHEANVLMVLTKTSELHTILSLGRDAGVEFVLVDEKPALFDEKDFLYRLRFKAADTA